ncbi:MAG: hypothetical protein ABSB66_15565 [Candidatus Acidiferrales bacterium]|jgi:hypothetical protein
MPQKCLFCDNKSGSHEHLWPAWIHSLVQIKTPIRIQIGAKPVQISPDPELTIKTVCGTCNNGWMSALEEKCIPIIGALVQDQSTPLDDSQKELLSAWALKTAMVTDSTNKRREPFYERSERVKLRENYTIPDRTIVWIGRASKSSLAALGTDVWIDIPPILKVAKSTATTIIVGHLVIQVFSIHVLSGHLQNDAAITAVQPKPGPWDDTLIPIWPIDGRRVVWPPKLTFDTVNHGPLSIAVLLDRWKIGQKAP